MERRSSVNSESSNEPMETSSSNKTGISDPYSSMMIKSNDSDIVESDEHDEPRPAAIQKMMNDALKQFLAGSNANHHHNNNNNNNCNKLPHTDSSTSPQQIESSTSQSLNLSGNNNTNSGDNMKYVCVICEAILTSAHEFSVHLRGHNNDSSDDNLSYKCRICKKVLSSSSSLDRHVLVHTGERPFKCKHCSLTFTTNGNMHRHVRKHNQCERINYESDGSTDSSNSDVSANSHNNNNNNNDYPKSGDDLSGKRKMIEDDLNNKRKLRAINNNNNNNNNIVNSKTQAFCCPLCNRNDFTTMLSLENHIDQDHPGIPAKCRHCLIVFKSHKALNAHRCGNVAKAPITDSSKDLTFVDFSADNFPIIARSLTAESRKYECPKCSKVFSSLSTMQIHSIECTVEVQNLSVRGTRHSIESDEDTERVNFFTQLDLQNKSQPMSVSSNAGTSDIMSTPSTDKSFNSSYSLKERLMSPYHNDTKDLADIQSIIHNTSASGGFWGHIDRPASEKDIDLKGNDQEEEAQDAFTAEFRKMKLRGEFPCRLCTSVFPNLRALKGHNRIHLSSAGPGPYRCNMCPFHTNDKAALIRHMRTHNGDRPYECANCNYAFTTKANCERHLRNRHGKNTRDEIKKSIIYHPSEDSSCDDPVKKMAMFTSPDSKRDEPPKASTPVSHLRSSLSFDTPKIQVRSLEKLIEQKSDLGVKPLEPIETKPVDLSMDVLDLSNKKSKTPVKEIDEDEDVSDDKNESDLSIFDKNHLLMLQHKFFSEAFPKLNHAQYFQLLYRNFTFPPTFPALNPLLFQSALFGQQTPPQEELKSFMATPQMSGGCLMTNPFASSSTTETSVKSEPKSLDRTLSPVRETLAPQPPTSTPIQPSPSLSPGPVKMVIKNGVLMPKQKQRRYRTERPFMCDHCSAKFTLRSNMERHIKQQHPQYWAQRQKGGHHLMRRGTGSIHPMIPQNIAPPNFPANAFGGISDQVKYAILSQQLKQGHDPSSMILHNALSNGGNNTVNVDDDEDKLVIDEEDSQLETPKLKHDSDATGIARQIAQGILEHAKRTSNKNILPTAAKENKELETRLAANYIPKPTQVEVNKEEDLASISKLVGNANLNFENFFNRPAEPVEQSEPVAGDQSDEEEGFICSGSASESNNSGTDDQNPSGQNETKKKSAYSLAPNRVSCPYCQRTFPWSSSLRRHILTHTGQKPFKCSHCPLLFTTKSNCDRHLVRKHGDVESAMSVPVPIEEMPEPKKERVISVSSTTTTTPTPVHELKQHFPIPQTLHIASSPTTSSNQTHNTTVGQVVLVNNSDLPFKCHLCDASYGDRTACLDHMKLQHHQEFSSIMAKVNLESESDVHTASPDDDDGVDSKGKYPDYANRKVMCAFCMRRFWSAEDLRRHVRTHSGERPFQCNVCMRRFTLKHSMLRHRKKHANKDSLGNNNSTGNSASDMSDEESTVPPQNLSTVNQQKIPDLISKDLVWKLALAQSERKEARDATKSNERDGENDDLIGNLLGIHDPGILNKLLSSPDEAAKLLGVKNNE